LETSPSDDLLKAVDHAAGVGVGLNDRQPAPACIDRSSTWVIPSSLIILSAATAMLVRSTYAKNAKLRSATSLGNRFS